MIGSATSSKQICVSFERVRDGHGFSIESPTPKGERSNTNPSPFRLARLLAHAHQLELRIVSSDIASRAEAAREMGVTRARLTQIINLTLLAPDIQEEILFTQAEPGHQPINEHSLRWVLRARDWPTQRTRWRDLNDA